jgi:hypothetical protein
MSWSEKGGNKLTKPDTMRLTTMTQSAKGLPDTMGEEEAVPLRDEVMRQLERTKWFLWHGNVFQALQVLTSVLFDLEMAACERDDGKISKLCKTVQEFYTFIDRNLAFAWRVVRKYGRPDRAPGGLDRPHLPQRPARGAAPPGGAHGRADLAHPAGTPRGTAGGPSFYALCRGREAATAQPLSTVSAWRAVRKYALQCGLPQIKPHDFRRFVGTELAKRNLRQAQRALGHQRLETTVAHDVLDELQPGRTEGLY